MSNISVLHYNYEGKLKQNIHLNYQYKVNNNFTQQHLRMPAKKCSCSIFRAQFYYSVKI